MKPQRAVLTILFSVLTAPVIYAQHADVRPDVSAGQIITHGWDDDASEFFPNLRIFGYDFQEDPEDPYTLTDPGVNTVGPTALPPGEELRFNILSADAFGLSSNLSFWGGSPGPVSFGPPVGGETLTLNFNVSNVVVGNSLGQQAGFNIQTIDEDGAVHRHLNSILSGSGVPTDGIYLIAMELSVTGLQDSLPFFIVYNNGLSETVHDEAIDWVTEHLLIGSDGDFDDDGDKDAADIDILWLIVRGTGADPGGNDTADLNNDSFVNEDDVDYMLANLLTAGPNRRYGDANLSGGAPELTDYNLWRTGTGGWAGGDFDGSGGTPELNDYNLWRTGPTQFPETIGPHGEGSGLEGAPLVPEPATWVLMGLASPVLIYSARRNRPRATLLPRRASIHENRSYAGNREKVLRQPRS